MKIRIVCHQNGVDISDYCDWLREQKAIALSIYPERFFEHPAELAEGIMTDIQKCIKGNRDYYVVSNYDTISYAVRVAIKESDNHNIDSAVIFFKNKNEEPLEIKIDKNGRYYDSTKGMFDTNDNLLIRLL